MAATKTTTTTIDDLPQDLLVHILSFLPTIDAVGASLISRKWRNLWHHTPTLNFDMTLHRHRHHHHTLSQTRETFAELITKTLSLRPPSTPLHSFTLHFSYRYHTPSQPQLHSSLRHVIASGPALLRLSFDEHPFTDDGDDDDGNSLEPYDKYDFRFSELIHPCKVRVLQLISCRVFWPEAYKTVVHCDDGWFCKLRSVSLHGVSLRDSVLSAVVSSCVGLEFLSLRDLRFLRNFVIRSGTLRELELGCYRAGVGCLDVCAPQLWRVAFDCFSVARYCPRDLSSLVEARVAFEGGWEELDCCLDVLKFVSGGVERVTLRLRSMRLARDMWLRVFDCTYTPGCFGLKNLKYLELKTGFTEDDLVGIATFLEFCPQLESLVLNHHCIGNEVLSKGFRSKHLVFHIPRLRLVTMKSFSSRETELYVVELLKLHNVALEKIVAFPPEAHGNASPPLVLLDKLL